MTPDERERLDLYKQVAKTLADKELTMISERDHYEQAIRKCEQAQQQAKLICYVLMAVAVLGAVVIYKIW
jgi:type IV secretory pathway component VirB8